MKYLKNDCKCGNLTVFPKTWERKNASLAKAWYINYRFYDPNFRDKYPEGKQVRIKGMNEYSTLEERQAATRKLLEYELHLLEVCDYNPITGAYNEYATAETRDYIVSPETPFSKALDEAFARIGYCNNAMLNMRSTLKYLKISIAKLRLDTKPVEDIKRRHLIMILDQCEQDKTTFTDSTYNHYLKDLKALFSVLEEIETIEYSPAEKMKFREYEKEKKELLTADERLQIDTHLPALNYPLWKFIHIFCNSGARTPEIMRLKYEDVDLEGQLVTYTVNKKRKNKLVTRPIKDSVLHLWQELINESSTGNYLFSKGLKPGPKPIREDQIKKRWRYWIQQKLKIRKTLYSLKYLNTDTMDALYGADVAAHLNQHSVQMVNKHYAVNQSDRKNNIIKLAPNSFTADTKKPA